MRTAWEPDRVDLIIAAAITLAFPLLAGWLFGMTGALLPMILYYSLAWGVSLWRRGSTGYFTRPVGRPPRAFYLQVGVIAAALVCAYQARITVPLPDTLGVLLTAIVWATLNASSEQLLWLYIFDSWDLGPIPKGSAKGKLVRRSIALVLFSVFVGTIHTLFWVRFLHTVDASMTLGAVFVVLTSVSGYLHIIVWRTSRRMVYTFIPHMLLNLLPLFWTGYSIVPYLIR